MYGSSGEVLQTRFQAAMSLADFVEGTKENRELWSTLTARAAAPADLVARAAAVPAKRFLLVLVEDWCGDAVNTVPSLGALADAAPNLELRVLGRDTNLDLMDRYLTNGSRSIPLVIVLDEHYRTVGRWGPRPADLQRWVLGEGQALEKSERYREVRRWYARDHARTTLEEVVALLERTSSTMAA